MHRTDLTLAEARAKASAKVPNPHLGRAMSVPSSGRHKRLTGAGVLAGTTAHDTDSLEEPRAGGLKVKRPLYIRTYSYAAVGRTWKAGTMVVRSITETQRLLTEGQQARQPRTEVKMKGPGPCSDERDHSKAVRPGGSSAIRSSSESSCITACGTPGGIVDGTAGTGPSCCSRS